MIFQSQIERIQARLYSKDNSNCKSLKQLGFKMFVPCNIKKFQISQIQMIIFFILISKVIGWNFNSTLLTHSLTGHLVNYATANNQVYITIFGGFSNSNLSYQNTLYVFYGANFTLLSSFSDGPSGRSAGCSAVYDDTIYYYGGQNATYYFDDLWSFNLTTLQWSQIVSYVSGSGRIYCGMTARQAQVLIFGGKNQNQQSTNLHYSIDLNTNTITSINLNSHYTTLNNKLWDGSVQSYTAEGFYSNYTSFVKSKVIWFSKILLSQSEDQMVIVQANISSSLIHILNKQSLLLKNSIYLPLSVDSCQIMNVGLFCGLGGLNTQTQIKFIFLRAVDWRKSEILSDYIQYNKWPIGLYQSKLFSIQNDLMVVVSTSSSIELYRLPKNQCTLNNNTASCFFNKAYCNPDYQGAYCDRETCSGSLIFTQPYLFQNFTFQCGGNGICSNGECVCDTPYTGSSCSDYNRTECQGEIQQMYPLSTCTCTNQTIGGNDCKISFCYNDCSSIGICSVGNCLCTLPYSGPDCSIIAIDIDFSYEQLQKFSLFLLLFFLH